MLILITIAILSMLGTALLSMSLMNITMKQNDKRIKATLYYSESGIDQVYARVGKFVEEAIEDAISSTDTDMKYLFNELDVIANYVDPITGLVDPTEHSQYDGLGDSNKIGITYLTVEDYALDIVALEAHANELYKGHFKNYLDTLEDNSDVTKRISYRLDNSSVPYAVILMDGLSTMDISYASVEKFIQNDPSTFIIRDVRSEFLLRGETKKVITTDIVVNDEITSYPLNTLEKRIVLKDNPIWQQAIVVNGDIEVNGDSHLYVEGNVYGMGTVFDLASYGNILRNVPTVNFGGIRFNDTSETVIEGNVYSRQYVQLSENSNAKMSVTDGAVYANSFIAQKGSNGSMSVSGNVYTQDDLEHNGRNADITIDGSYYGYSDGSTSKTHDSSSAIVINANTKDSTISPTLTITGVAPTTGNHIEKTAGVIVGGTGYIDEIINTTESERYQMAESIAFRENSLAYTWAFNDTIISDLINDITEPYVAREGNHYGFYADDATQDANLTKYLLKDNVSWHSVGTNAQLAVGYDADPQDDTDNYDDLSELSDKKAIFATFQNKIDTTGIFVHDGDGNVNISNYIYTTGLQLVSNHFEMDSARQSEFESLSNKITKDYLYQLQKLNPRNEVPYTYIQDIDGVLTEEIDYTILESVNGNLDPDVNNANPVYKYTNIENPSYGTQNWDVEDTGSLRLIKNISDATADVLYISGIAGVNDNDHIYLDGDAGFGVILRNGDIHIGGNVDFTGALICNGTLYIDDGADVDLHNKSYDLSDGTKEAIARMIYDDDELYNILQVTNYYDSSDADPIYLDDVEFIEINFEEDTFDSQNNSVQTYYDWIYLDHWKVVE